MRKTVRFPETRARKHRTSHRPMRKRANQRLTPRATQAGSNHNRALAYQEEANPCSTPTSQPPRHYRKENPHGAGTRGKPRTERGQDMHCTHEGRKAENRQTAEKGPEARKEGSNAPKTLVSSYVQRRGAGKGGTRPKRGKRRLAATTLLEAPINRSATQPTLPQRRS